MKLVKLQFINCQSFEDVTYEFALDKINAIYADNNIGKSIMFKMMREAVCPGFYSKDKSFLIRTGCAYAEMYSENTDGVYTCFRLNRTGNNVYSVLYPDGTIERTSYATEEYLKNLCLLADLNNFFIVNVIDRNQDLMLVDKNLKASEQCLHMTMQDENLELVKEKIPEYQTEFKNYLNQLSSKYGAISDALRLCEYTDIDFLQVKLQLSTAAKNIADVLCTAWENVEQLNTNRSDSLNYEVLNTLISIASQADNLIAKIDDAIFIERVTVSASKVASLSVALATILKSLTSISVVESLNYDTLHKLLVLGNALQSTTSLLSCLKVKGKDYAMHFNIAKIATLVVSACKTLSRVQVSKDSSNLYILTYLASAMKSIAISIGELLTIQKQRAENKFYLECITEYLNESKHVVTCPIYGEVEYDGKKCVSYNN